MWLVSLVSYQIYLHYSVQVSIFLLIGVILAGAALGYWIVRKFVISEDGGVDEGVAQFVKWAMRVVATTLILQVYLSLNFYLLQIISSMGGYYAS